VLASQAQVQQMERLLQALAPASLALPEGNKIQDRVMRPKMVFRRPAGADRHLIQAQRSGPF
jgi:hypothetical protein